MPVSAEFAERQLDRVLGFFPRVDAKATALFAIDAALLGYLSAKFELRFLDDWQVALPASVCVLLLIAAFAFIFRCSFPNLEGGAGSLIYFREVAKRTESTFTNDFAEASEAEIRADIVCQIWRNSQILRLKFDALKLAFVSTALALIPWCIFIAASSWKSA